MCLFRKKKKASPLLLSDEDMKRIDKTVSDHIGKFDTVLHEIVSPDLHIDVIPVPPSAERDYYTLVTMGMSGYRMPVPDGFEK